MGWSMVRSGQKSRFGKHKVDLPINSHNRKMITQIFDFDRNNMCRSLFAERCCFHGAHFEVCTSYSPLSHEAPFRHVQLSACMPQQAYRSTTPSYTNAEGPSLANRSKLWDGFNSDDAAVSGAAASLKALSIRKNSQCSVRMHAVLVHKIHHSLCTCAICCITGNVHVPCIDQLEFR